MDDVFTSLGGRAVVSGWKAQRREFAAPLRVSASDLQLQGGR
jgi:hypothetical protein